MKELQVQEEKEGKGKSKTRMREETSDRLSQAIGRIGGAERPVALPE